jgi:hypothetical protein
MVKPSAAGVVFMVLMLIARLLAWIEAPDLPGNPEK